MLEKDIATLTFRVRQCGESAGSLTANTEDLRIGSRGHTYAGSEAERGNIGHNSSCGRYHLFHRIIIKYLNSIEFYRYY